MFKGSAGLRAKLAFGGLVGLTLLACGGGGGGASSGGGGGGGGVGWTALGAKPEPGVYLEFLRGGIPTDSMNLSVGDVVTVDLANYDLSGARTVLSGATFTLSGGGGKVSLVGNKLTVTGTLSTKFTVSGKMGSTTYKQQGHVASGTVVAKGRILSSDLVTPVPLLQVELYNSAGTLVGGGQTDPQGNFSILTTSAATLLGIEPSTVTPGYFQMAKFNGKFYSTSGTTCGIKLPALSGSNISLGSDLQLIRLVDGPPPPPNACGS